MDRLILLSLFFFISLNAFGQDDFLDNGNTYLNRQEYEKAEEVFRQAIKSEPDNLIYHCQLGLALVQQKKYQKAESFLQKVLEKDSTHVGALWYSGIGNYKAGNDRMAIKRFENVLPLLDESSGQYYSANWFIGKSYSALLRTVGLTYQETDRMLESFEEYLRIQPDAKDSEEIREYVERKKKRRPTDNVEIWVDM